MKEKIKVLILEGTIAPYMLPLYERLSGDFNLHVMFCAAKMKERLWSPNLAKYSFKKEILKNIFLGPFVINPTLPSKLLFQSYDLLYFMDAPRHISSQFLAFLITKLRRKKLIIGSVIHHGTQFPIYINWIVSPEKSKLLSSILEKGVRGLLNTYRKIIYRHANVVAAFSNKTREYVLKLGIPQDKIITGGYSTPEALLCEVRDSANRAGNKKVVLCVSYLKKYKGIDCLIRAFKGLRRDDAVLMIMGSGEEEESLKSLAREEKNIIFLGYLEGEEKARYYLMADIFVLPTLYDAWGLVINEAMYYGLPIITTDAAGATDLIKGNGIIVKAGDETQLRHALEDLLNNAGLRKEMGRKSKEIIKNYNTEYIPYSAL
jgi:glycosyltransferase involved in cell wall biosynthesis